MPSVIYVISSSEQSRPPRSCRPLPQIRPRRGDAAVAPTALQGRTATPRRARPGPAALISCPKPHGSKTTYQTQVGWSQWGWDGKSPRQCSFALSSVISILESFVSSCQMEFYKQGGQSCPGLLTVRWPTASLTWYEVWGDLSLSWQALYCRKWKMKKH